jgi:N-acetylmuramoyl-L-alanine amidase
MIRCFGIIIALIAAFGLCFDAFSQTRQPGARYFKGKVPYPVLKPAGPAKPLAKPVIVIDPGHGGHDPGAIGQKGTHEKSITYSAAKELRTLLLASGRYKVIMTRGSDRYIEHSERLRIARAGGADLFISIHADSTSNKNARGPLFTRWRIGPKVGPSGSSTRKTGSWMLT